MWYSNFPDATWGMWRRRRKIHCRAAIMVRKIVVLVEKCTVEVPLWLGEFVVLVLFILWPCFWYGKVTFGVSFALLRVYYLRVVLCLLHCGCCWCFTFEKFGWEYVPMMSVEMLALQTVFWCAWALVGQVCHYCSLHAAIVVWVLVWWQRVCFGKIAKWYLEWGWAFCLFWWCPKGCFEGMFPLTRWWPPPCGRGRGIDWTWFEFWFFFCLS